MNMRYLPSSIFLFCITFLLLIANSLQARSWFRRKPTNQATQRLKAALLEEHAENLQHQSTMDEEQYKQNNLLKQQEYEARSKKLQTALAKLRPEDKVVYQAHIKELNRMAAYHKKEAQRDLGLTWWQAIKELFDVPHDAHVKLDSRKAAMAKEARAATAKAHKLKTAENSTPTPIEVKIRALTSLSNDEKAAATQESSLTQFEAQYQRGVTIGDLANLESRRATVMAQYHPDYDGKAVKAKHQAEKTRLDDEEAFLRKKLSESDQGQAALTRHDAAKILRAHTEAHNGTVDFGSLDHEPALTNASQSLHQAVTDAAVTHAARQILAAHKGTTDSAVIQSAAEATYNNSRVTTRAIELFHAGGTTATGAEHAQQASAANKRTLPHIDTEGLREPTPDNATVIAFNTQATQPPQHPPAATKPTTGQSQGTVSTKLPPGVRPLTGRELKPHLKRQITEKLEEEQQRLQKHLANGPHEYDSHIQGQIAAINEELAGRSATAKQAAEQPQDGGELETEDDLRRMGILQTHTEAARKAAQTSSAQAKRALEALAQRNAAHNPQTTGAVKPGESIARFNPETGTHSDGAERQSRTPEQQEQYERDLAEATPI